MNGDVKLILLTAAGVMVGIVALHAIRHHHHRHHVKSRLHHARHRAHAEHGKIVQLRRRG